MKTAQSKSKIGTVELIYFLIGVLVLLVLAAIIGKGQSGTQQRKAIVALNRFSSRFTRNTAACVSA